MPAMIQDGGAHAAYPLFVFLVIDRITALTDSRQLGFERGGSRDCVTGQPRHWTFTEYRVLLSRRQIGEDSLADRRAMHGIPHSNSRRHPYAATGLDLVQVQNLTGVQRAEVDGLLDVIQELLQMRPRAFANVEAAYCDGSQLEESQAQVILPRSGIAFDD